LENYFAIKVEADTKSLYRSFAILVFKDEEKYKVIKTCQLFIVLEYLDYFRSIFDYLSDEIKLDNFITLKDNSSFYFSLDMLASSILFNLPIVCYSLGQTMVFNLTSKKYFQKPFLIAKSNEYNNEFVPLIKKVFDSDLSIKKIKNPLMPYIQSPVKIKTNY
jgi:hypothetical protein